MPFLSDPLSLLAVLVTLILLNFGLFFWLLRLSRHYNSLTKGINKKHLMSALEGIQKTLATHERELALGKKSRQQLKSAARLHLQKLTLKRFNPFSDTGGDQSFILAILDGNKDGVVITSLHSRENTRFYVKSVKSGVGVEHPLSREEQKLLQPKRS